LYPDVRTALGQGCTKLRIIEDVTESAGSSLDFLSPGSPVVIYIDPGVTWTPPPFSNDFSGISLSIFGSSEGASSTLRSPVGLSSPLFFSSNTVDNFILEGVHWQGISGINGSRLVNSSPIVRISYATVTIPDIDGGFIGSSIADNLQVSLSHVTFIGSGLLCSNIIIGSSISNVTIMSCQMNGTYSAGTNTINVSSSYLSIDTLTATNTTVLLQVAGQVSNVQANTTLGTILEIYATFGNTTLANSVEII
jgi:hypothetical protein